MRGMLTSIQNFMFHTNKEIKRLKDKDVDTSESDKSQ